MKNKLKTHFYYCWYLYIIVGLLVGFLSNYFITLKTKTRDNEKISFYIGSNYVNTEKLEKILFKDTNEQLKEISILDYNENDMYFAVTLQSIGILSDFAILPIDKISENLVYGSFLSLDSLDLSFLGNDIEYYKINNQKFGIIVHNDTISYQNDNIVYTHDKTYCLFITTNCCNINSIYKSGKKRTSDNGIQVLSNFFKL